MKFRTKVNFIAIVFTVIVGGLIYGFVKFNENGGFSRVAVKGTETDLEVNIQPERILESIEGEEKIAFVDFSEKEPDSPKKKETAGNFYARAKSAIALDAETGAILHYQDGAREMAIASLTKIMTAVIVVENIDDLEKEIVTVDEEAVYVEGTKVGCPRSGYCISNRLQVGEKISARSLLDAMLLNSANDAAIALAKHIAGSQQKFSDLMNRKTQELGLINSNFCNPSGLDEDDNPGGCYSSAYDMARIAAYSLKYDEIWGIMKTKEKEVYSADGKIVHRIVNTDLLIDQLPNCIGGKTGFTYEAGQSLMMAAYHPEDAKRKVVAVLLDDFYRWQDMKDLLSWSFKAYIWK